MLIYMQETRQSPSHSLESDDDRVSREPGQSGDTLSETFPDYGPPPIGEWLE